MITKILRDDLGRIVGKGKVLKGTKGNVEYGGRRGKCADVTGIAQLITVTEFKKTFYDKKHADYIINNLQEYEVF